MNALGLKQFLQRKEVLDLFRAFMKTTKGVDDLTKREVVKQVRREFDRYKSIDNSSRDGRERVKELLREGNAQLKKLDEMLSMARVHCKNHTL
mmetsp:Transcript_2164/g.4462  ORF Transcript_2164/g.4462 Transcript_2164/m.4462 type:complete len:93 (-) Transcript_2164:20-298(-)